MSEMRVFILFSCCHSLCVLISAADCYAGLSVYYKLLFFVSVLAGKHLVRLCKEGREIVADKVEGRM